MKASRFQPSIILDHGSVAPLCLQLAEQFRQEACRQRVLPQTPVISERSLAESLNIGRNTVHQAYSLLAEEGVLSLPSVRGSGPRISGDVRLLYSRPYPNLVLILPYDMTSYVSQMRRRSLELVAGVMDHAAQLGISVKVCPLPADDASESDVDSWLQSILSRTIGVVTLGGPERPNPGYTALMNQREIPQVFVSGKSSLAHISTVTVDLEPGVRQMLERLREGGHGRLLLVDYDEEPLSPFVNCARERGAVISRLAVEYGIETRRIGIAPASMDVPSELLSDFDSSSAIWFHNDALADRLIPGLLKADGARFSGQVFWGYDSISSRGDVSSLNHDRLAMAAMAVDMVVGLYQEGRPGEAKHRSVPCRCVCQGVVNACQK